MKGVGKSHLKKFSIRVYAYNHMAPIDNWPALYLPVPMILHKVSSPGFPGVVAFYNS